MNRPNDTKLKLLLSGWPDGVVLTSKYLKNKGYYKQLIKLYRDKGWIKSLGRGAYTRLNDTVSWEGAVNALQFQLDLPLHVGGLTALELVGISQYSTLNHDNPKFYLFNSKENKICLPVWFREYFLNCYVVQTSLFKDDYAIYQKNINGVMLNIASPERAILEVLAKVSHFTSLSHANELIELSDRLRPDVMQRVLESCKSIKVKRLFLYLADRNALSFYKDLNQNRIELGKGKRVICQGGTYVAKWMISLPSLDDYDNMGENNV
jgi:hypothetical protein